MIAYLLQVTICLFAFYTLYAVIFSRETFFSVNRWYLMGTLCISLVMPLLLKLPQAVLSPDTDTAFIYTLEPVAVGMQNITASLTTQPITPLWMQIALGVYWLGVCLFLVRMILGLRTIMRMYLKGDRTKTTQGRCLVYSSHLHLPFSFFNWIFLSKQHEMTETELDEILEHETAHISALHSVDVLIMELACIFLWPSPMIYLYRKSLRHVHEYLADAVVLKRTPLKQYGELLISQASSGMQLALANHFFQSQLKNRILMMTKNKSHRIALGKYAVLLPVLLFVFILFAFRQGDEKQHQLQHAFSIERDSVPGEVYKVVDEMPRFPGCEDSGLTDKERYDCSVQKMLEHVYQNISYPKEAREQGISGNVVVKFVIRHDGMLSHAQMVKWIGFGTDEAVLDVLKSMPQWRPGYHQGKAVDVELTLPITFALDNPSNPDRKELNEDDVVVRALGSPTPEPAVYKVVEEMPRFPGCEDSGLTGTELETCSHGKLIEYVYTNLKYPVEAKEKGITGRSIVQFTVQQDGTLKDVSVIRSLGYGTDDAIFDLMSTMPKWRPGYQKGKAVNVQFTLPVVFKLPGSESSGEVFKVVEQMPRFPGCEDSGLTGQDLTNCANEKLFAFVLEHIRYPEEAKKAGITGRGVLQFTIRADGQLTDGRVVRSLGYGTDAVMMDLYKSMQEMSERWIPGHQGGRAVDVEFTLPVKFELPK